jgi:hypothetical protein
MKQNQNSKFCVRTLQVLNGMLIAATTAIFVSCAGNPGSTTTTDSTNVDSNTVSMSDNGSSMTKLEPKGDDPAWGPTITDEMLVVIEKLLSYGAPPLETLTPCGSP